MHRGKIWLWRKTADPESGLMSNPALFTLWCKCLLTASYCRHVINYMGQEITLEPGEFIFGRGTWASHLNLTEKVVRNLIGTLQKRAMIKASKRASKFTVFSIVNWELYQDSILSEGQQKGQQKGQHRASTGPTINKGDKGENINLLPILPESGNGEIYLTAKKRKLSGLRLELFKRFWSAWGDKNGKAEAADSWLDIREFSPALAETIIAAAAQEAVRRETIKANGGRFKWAQGWLTAKRWEDVGDHPKPNEATTPKTPQQLLTMRSEWEASKQWADKQPEIAKTYWPVLTTEEKARYGQCAN